MSESKHTPGPWKFGWSAEVGNFDKGISIIAPDGRGEVARVVNMERNKAYSDDEPHDETQANARLIVMVPELLGLVEMAASIRDCDVRDADEVRERAEKILDKLQATTD